MEMATQTKACASATTTTTTATVKAATGNGNSYTQNISTVKEHKGVEQILFYKESSAEIQNDKSKIKISQCQRQRNHLKFLINLYLKLILCISQVNITILKIFKTNFSYTSNYAPKCIINVQQKLQAKAKYFKTISFKKFKTIIDFLIRFHYAKRKNQINYVKLTIRHFVGICLKRLISLKRLQQIPENHEQKDKPLSSIYNKAQVGNLQQLNDQDLPFSREYIISLKNIKDMESLKAWLNIREESVKEIQNCRCCQPVIKKCYKEKLLSYKKSCSRINQSFNSKFNLIKNYIRILCSDNSTKLKERTISHKELMPSSSSKNRMDAITSSGRLNFKLSQLFLKFDQLDAIHIKINLQLKTKAAVSPAKLQYNSGLNTTGLQEDFLYYFGKKYKLSVILRNRKFNRNQFEVILTLKLQIIAEYSQQAIQFNPFSSHKCCPQNQHKMAFDYCCSYKGQLAAKLASDYQDSLEIAKRNLSRVKYNGYFKLAEIIIDSSQKYEQIGHNKVKCESYEQIKAYLLTKCQETFTKKPDQLSKLKTNAKQELSTNSTQFYSQLKKHRVLYRQEILETHPIKANFKTKLQETFKRRHDQLTIRLDNDIWPPSIYSPLQCSKLNKYKKLMQIYIFTAELTKLPNLIEIRKETLIRKMLHINTENQSKLLKPLTLLALPANQNNPNILECLLQNIGKLNENIQLQESKFQNATDNSDLISMAHENNRKCDNTSHKQAKIHQKFFYENGLRRQPSLRFINREKQENKMKLAYRTNIARQFQSDDNSNSYQVESKQQKIRKKCQHILYSIILYCCFCCSCNWHIYGFPLVLVKMFKYLKDATMNVLTRRFEIPTIAASKCYNDGNIKAACDGKLYRTTEVADYKANQQNVLKRQTTTHTTSIFSTAAYSSSYCSTISLTTSSSSSYCKPVKNSISIQQPFQQPCTSYCCYHHYQHQHRHHYHHRHHHYHLDKREKQETMQQHHQQLQLPHQYKFISTIHLQLPSLLVFSRTLIILMLLSSLWHTSEGFHGSGVKLSTNTVRTKYGLVRGIVVRSSPSLVEAYLGIPYASPPVGSLRFMPPITPSTWKNIRNADRFSPVCPQNVPIPPNGPEALLEVPRARLAQLRRLLPLLSNQSEDCLYLNIYVPFENRRHRRFTNSGELHDAPKLPAILFIHGESYEWNSGNPYDGSELAAHGNVIVITINFRLGILGFLKTGGKESAQGNFGLMDLVAGLHWLKENLPAFGGDPQQITLLGHGTGAALANILVVSPVASDLIQHAVMVSGSALSPWAIQKNPLFVKRRVAEQTGCHGDMLYYDLAPCLRTKTINELLAVKIDHPRFLVGFAPFIDGTVISPNTDSVGKLSLPLGSAIVSTSGIEYANFPKRNLIFCLTSVESHLDLNAQDLEFGFNETRRDRILRTYVRNNFHYHLNEIFAVLKNEYTEWDKAIRSPLSSRDATLQFLSDGHTASSLIKLGYMHSLRGGRGYFLHFKHRTVEEEYPQRTGSVRGEDVPFWLGLPISPLFPHNYTTQEKQISRLMLRYLANFAKTGNPNRSSLSSPLPSTSSLIVSPPSSSSSSTSTLSSSSSGQTAIDSPDQITRSSFKTVNDTSSTSSGPNKSSNIIDDVATAAAREALNLAVLYNQRRTKRTYYKRHSRSNDDNSDSASGEVNYFLSTNHNNNKLDSDELPFWDAYDVVNQLYMELGNKAEIQSHYRGHKLSMWLNLIPQLHRHANMNDQSMRHHQFQDDLNNLNLYEGIVRAQIQTKPDDDDETLLLPKVRPTPSAPAAQENNITEKLQGATTECGVDGAMFVAEMTTLPPTDNRSLVLDSREKELATASTGLIGNLEVLRRLSGKQFQSYTTALVATVAVGCFLLILNILIFAGIYHQREKRARDAKTKEELQDNDTSKNSSILKLNSMGSETGSFNDSGANVSGKTTVVFGEYSCYDEKSLHNKTEKLIVELPPAQMLDASWPGCSTSTLDLLKTKHHTPLNTSYTLSNVVPISTESQTEHLMAINNLEMVTYNPLPMATGLIIDPSFAGTSSSAGLLSKRGSFVGSSGQLNQYDFASVQSSDKMSFKDIENAVKASAAMNDDITQDDDIPEPPPPPRSFQSMQQQQQQQQQQSAANASTATAGGSGGGGILRQAGATSATQTGGGKKRVHIQEISV